MGYKCSFMDNEVYSAQDVNERFSKFFTSGVGLAESGNILADLNGITEDIAESGVLQDACKVIKTDTGYRISAGTAIMSDGSCITFDAEGHDFTISTGTYHWVYLVRNDPKNTIDIMVSESEPTGDFVLLAQISAGEVYDRRKYAMLKINSCQSGTLRNFYEEFYSSEGHSGSTYDAGVGNFSYVVVWEGESDISGTLSRLNAYNKCVMPIEDGNELAFNMITAAGKTHCIFYVKKNGQTIETRMNPGYSYADYSISFGVI